MKKFPLLSKKDNEESDSEMQSKVTIFIKDFSTSPARVVRADGPKSAESFRDDVLYPALIYNDIVTVSFDGVTAFAASFLKEAFGGLIEIGFDVNFIRKHLVLTTSEDVMKDYIRLSWRYINRT